MTLAAAVLSTLVLLSSFWLLVARRIQAAVNGYAVQSILLGGLAIALFFGSGGVDLLALGILAILVKGLLIPVVVERQAGAAYSRRELRYTVGFPTALLLGAALTLVGFVAAGRLPFHADLLSEPVFGMALAVTLLGLFTAVARRDAVLQLTGLLSAENGLILVGLVISSGLGLLIELSLFLDVLVGVAVMSFLIARIHETVATTDTSELKRLRG